MSRHYSVREREGKYPVEDFSFASDPVPPALLQLVQGQIGTPQAKAALAAAPISKLVLHGDGQGAHGLDDALAHSGAFDKFYSALGTLESLDRTARARNGMTPVEVDAIARHCPKLRKLVLGSRYLSENTLLAAVAGSLGDRITHLRISGTLPLPRAAAQLSLSRDAAGFLVPRNLDTLARMRNLEVLDLGNVDGALTEAHLFALYQFLPRLQSVNFNSA